MAKSVASHFSSSLYLNYDSASDREIILEESWLSSTELLIFDEIHKMNNWKNYIKGVYDTKNPEQKILVTGSARLEVFQEVGDSLAGRYFLHRLLPFSPSECKYVGADFSLDRFLERGGFPEPLLAENVIDADRWRLLYIDSLLREDVLNFDNIHNVKAIRLIFEMLRNRVGSPVSYSSIAEDIGVSPNTVKKYIQVLEALYIVFRVSPYSHNIARSLLKEPKIYFFDAALVKGDNGSRLENLVATCLLKEAYAKTDRLGVLHEIRYLQTKEKQEVDFALQKNDLIEKIIEVKNRDSDPSPSLKYFHNKYGMKSCQIVKELKKEKEINGIQILNADKFLKSLDPA